MVFFNILLIIYEYTVAVFRHTRRHQISLQMVVEPPCGCWDLNSGRAVDAQPLSHLSRPPPSWFLDQVFILHSKLCAGPKTTRIKHHSSRSWTFTAATYMLVIGNRSSGSLFQPLSRTGQVSKTFAQAPSKETGFVAPG